MDKRRLGAIAVGAALMAMTADRPATFSYDPAPRWHEEPETGEVCEAIEKECAGFLKDGGIDTAWGYAEYYNADGYLVGLKSVKSTGCKPLDEELLVSHRHFATVLSEGGSPDLDDIRVEVAAGVDRDSVRLVKTGETQVSYGC